MPDPGAQEHLQPALLDRLTDDAPGESRESRDRRVLSVGRLRECVLRDLSWLLNTGNLTSAVDLEAYPEVAASVLNFGIPSLAGATTSSLDAAEVEKLLRQAIWDFEPRILRKTVRVRVDVDGERMTQNAVTFRIEGELYAEPAPIRLALKTEVDLESGDFTVTEDVG